MAVDGEAAAGSAGDGGEASGAAGEEFSAIAPLLEKFRDALRVTACERVEHALEREEADVRIGELESKLRSRRQANQASLRRVQMLELALQETLQVCRRRPEAPLPSDVGRRQLLPPGFAGVSAAASAGATPKLPPGGLPGRPALEALLHRRKNSLSARAILEDALAVAEAAGSPEAAAVADAAWGPAEGVLANGWGGGRSAAADGSGEELDSA
eukprot:CAMPEP_0183518382 /NCGR_PEP_ID=MMETSP0371-20130417/15462_1 /TAXON_ID=268820 /ORGANISM="Peridinium aciculiferum, Strain PAER-2" /LENGTH=213 /DNA_ID=CAMNT_0025716417 /DNA_START=14 /DNA_END=653 /DNA_ORIENTATION=-